MKASLLGLFLLTLVATDSQQPPANQQGQRPAPVATQQQPIAQPPVSLNVSVNPTVITNGPSTGQQPDNDGTKADWTMVYWTAGATVIGFILAVIAGLQFRSQTTQTVEALRYAKDGLDTARRDLVLSHRPKLIVRNVVVDGLKAGVGFVPTTTTGGESKIANCRLWVTNVGLTDAMVLRSEIQWHFGKSLPMENPINADVLNGGVSDNTVIKAGEIHIIRPPDFSYDFSAFQAINNAAEGMRSDEHLWLIGYLRYKSLSGDFLRHTFFCRKYDAKRGFFKIDAQRADYNYED